MAVAATMCRAKALLMRGNLIWRSKWNIVVIKFFSTGSFGLFRPFQGRARYRMIFIPPREFGPINRRAVTAGRAAFQPQRAFFVLPDAHGVAIEFFAAMQTPFLVVQVRPFAT